METGIWLPIAGVVLICLIVYFLARTPSEADKHQAEAIVRGAAGLASSNAGSAAPSPSRERHIGEQWTLWGWVLAVLGAISLTFALLMNTTVETSLPGVLGDGERSEIVNLDLLFKKGVAVAGSFAAIGFGVFCLGVGAIIGAIRIHGSSDVTDSIGKP